MKLFIDLATRDFEPALRLLMGEKAPAVGERHQPAHAAFRDRLRGL